MGRELAGYVECHQALGSTLGAAKAEMEAAAKAAQEEARKKTEERKKKAEKPTDKRADTCSFDGSNTPRTAGDRKLVRRLTTPGE